MAVVVQGTRDIPIGELTRYPGNPRRGNVGEIRASVRRLGQYRPIVFRDTGTALIILAGNHTTQAIEAEGGATVRGEIITCTDDDARRINLADNRLAELGGYDDTDLTALLKELDGDFDGIGWTQDDLDELLDQARSDGAGGNDPDEIPEPPAEPITRLGDLWQLGPHRLLCGSSANADDVIRLMNGERAVLMATDPPYLVSYDGQNHPPSEANSGSDKRNKEWRDYQEHAIGDGLYYDFLNAAIQHALEPAAPIYQWHAGTRAELLIDAWQRNGVVVHQQIIWVKARKVLTYADFMPQHEPCYFGWQKGNRPGKDRRAPVETPTVWEQDQVGETGAGHPTQKPVRLIRDPVRWHTRPGELIYEPFGGSGTALMAAEVEGRRCNAMELAPAFCDVICERFRKHTGITPELVT